LGIGKARDGFLGDEMNPGIFFLGKSAVCDALASPQKEATLLPAASCKDYQLYSVNWSAGSVPTLQEDCRETLRVRSNYGYRLECNTNRE